MNCKKCGKELEEELELCPQCAEEEQTEEVVTDETEAEAVVEETQKEAKKPAKSDFEPVSPWKLIAATAVCVLLLVVLVFAVIYGITGKLPYDLGGAATTAATNPVATTVPPKTYTASELGLVDGIMTKDIYSGDAADLAATANEVVVTMGSQQLTNAQLQIMYWNQFYRFATQYDYSSTGFDPSKPHNEQMFPQSDFTWEQYLLSGALQTWQQYAALCIAAEKEGYELPVNVQQDLTVLIDEYDKQAKENGFADANALLTAQMGPGVTLDDLLAVETMFAIGDNYYTEYCNGLEYTRADVEAYFDANAAMFANNYGVSKDTGKLVDVRHVLLQPEGCEFDESNYVVATDEQWEACRVQAQAMLDAWAAEGASEDAFATLAAEHTKDGGSQSTGGLYQFVTEGQMVPAFNDWCFDEARKPGDYGLVKTEFGYHLMYFVTSDDAWYIYATQTSDGYVSGQGLKKINEYMDANPLSVLFEKVTIGVADLTKREQTEPTEPATTEPATTETAAPTTAAE